MSTPNESLIVHLNFEEVEESKNEQGKVVRKVLDQSGKNNHGTIEGTPKLIPDDEFGSCLSFDGKSDYISFPTTKDADYSSGLTIEAWVFFSASDAGSCIFELNNSEQQESISLWTNDRKLSLHIARGSEKSGLTSPNPLNKGEWTHIAATVDKDGSAVLYINGKLETASAVLKPKGLRRHITIGKSGAKYLQGKLASARLYNSVLSEINIKEGMHQDETASATFRASYPLNFRLYDAQNGEPIVYVTDSADGRKLILEISNESRKDITVGTPESQEVNPANHHFELLLRPGTLSEAALKRLRLSANDKDPVSGTDWLLYKPTAEEVKSNGGFVSLYFLRKSAHTINPGGRITVDLYGLGADPAAGERSTRCELKFRNLSYPGDPPLRGARTQLLSVVSHRGQKSIPLYVGFIKSNVILNDGSANDLTLIIANTSDQRLILDPAQSKFVISFDVKGNEGTEKSWALVRQDETKNIQVKAEGWTRGGPNLAPALGRVEWELKPTKTCIDSKEEIVVTICNIKTKLAAGTANVYVRYMNIADHWGGEFLLPIEKAPIRYNDKADKPLRARLDVLADEFEALTVQSSDRMGTAIQLRTEIEQWNIYCGAHENTPLRGKLVFDCSSVGGYGVLGRSGMTFDRDGTLCIGSVGSGKPGAKLALSSQILDSNDQRGTPRSITVTGACLFGSKGGLLGTDGTNSAEWALRWEEQGGVDVNRWITAPRKNFRIPHPVKADYQLVHACLEGPEFAVYYRGSGRLTEGKATVKLPDYFEALTLKQDRTVTLTAKGREPYLLSYEDIHEGEFPVYGTKSDGEFSWEVKAVRADVEHLQVEVKSNG